MPQVQPHCSPLHSILTSVPETLFLMQEPRPKQRLQIRCAAKNALEPEPIAESLNNPRFASASADILPSDEASTIAPICYF